MKKINFNNIGFYNESFPINITQLSGDGFYFAKDNWDDFGFKTTYEVVVKIDESVFELGYINLSQYPYSDEIINFNNLKKNLSSYKVISLGNRKYYEFLNEVFDSNDRERYFTTLGDLAYNIAELKKLYENPEYRTWGQTRSDLIQNSFFRNNNYKEVLTQFHRMALGGRFHEAYEIDIQNTDGEEVLHFKIDPESSFPDSLYAIIGNNGSGKTYFIKQLINLYLEQTGRKEVKTSADQFSESSQLKEFESLICISYSPFDSNIPRDEYDNYKFIGIDFSSKEELSVQITKDISRLFEDAGLRYRGKLEKIIDKFSFDPWFMEILVYIQSGKFSEEIINILSSGQKIILLSLLSLILNVSEKTLVIIDEPELFLHPPLLKAYISAIEEIVREGNGACLLATHSAIVLQEIPHFNVRKIYFDREINQHKICKIQLKTFGENVSSINDFIFGTDLRNTGFYQRLKNMIDDGREVPQSLKDVLGDEAILLIKMVELKK